MVLRRKVEMRDGGFGPLLIAAVGNPVSMNAFSKERISPMCFRPPTVEAGPVKCPKCGAEVDPTLNECPSCGAKAAPDPGVPGAPGAPGVPVAPGVPKAPGAPGAPKAPGA